jgi:hypothetical protein
LALLGTNYDIIRGYNAELVAGYYTDLVSGESMTPAEVSEVFNEVHKWPGGWRIQDIDKTIWNGGCADECLFQAPPVFFVLSTATMAIDSFNPIGFEGIIEAIQKIDEESP